MAIIYEGIKCPICNKEINIDEPYFASFAFDHPLSDAAIHWHCFYLMNDWEKFLEKMFQISVEGTKDNNYWKILESNPFYMISTNDRVVRLNLKVGGISLEVSADDWQKSMVGLIQNINLKYLPQDQLVIAEQVCFNILDKCRNIT